VDRDTFLAALRDSRLLSDEQVAGLADRFCTGDPTHDLASSLVSAGLLTPFQARRLAEGEGAGLVVGQYRILEELGRGGFGQVYKALHVVMERVVAVKVIAPELVEEDRARALFKREVKAATQLYHPNIVMAYDANEDEGLLFLVMEFIDGCDLETLVRRQGPLPISVACELMRQAGAALQYAHERGMVHRDVKPANLLIPRPPAPPGTSVAVKVADFGLARLHSSMNGNTLLSRNEGSFLGTPDYVSPEQALDSSAVDIRSDLYSLGCTFYYALAGRKPFRGGTVFETLLKHREEDPEPLEALRPEVPAGLAAVVRRLMEKDPAKRFQTPAEVVAELAFLYGPDGAGAAPTARPSGTAAPVRKPDPPGEPAESSPTRFVAGLAHGKKPPRPSGGIGERAGDPPLTAVTDRGKRPPGHRDPPARARPSAPDPNTAGEKGGATCVLPSLAAPEGPASPKEATWRGDEAVAGPEESSDRTLALSQEGAGEAASIGGNLRTLWRQWTAVVEALARDREESPLGAEAYRLLHRELLQACRAQAGFGGERRDLLRRLESLVEPWLTAQTLASTDRAVLASLVLRCREFDRELFGARPPSSLGRWAALFVLALLGGLAALYFQDGRARSLPAKFSVASLWRIVETYPTLSITLALPAVILVSIYLASRLLRS
jgi:serine/threonine protein kinase